MCCREKPPPTGKAVLPSEPQALGTSFDTDAAEYRLSRNVGHLVSNLCGTPKVEADLEGRTELRLGKHVRQSNGYFPRHVVTVEGAEGTWTIHHLAGTGGMFGGNPLRQEIGLGPAERLVSIEIQWPGSGTVDVLEGLDQNQAYRVREGSASAEHFERRQVRLGGR